MVTHAQESPGIAMVRRGPTSWRKHPSQCKINFSYFIHQTFAVGMLASCTILDNTDTKVNEVCLERPLLEQVCQAHIYGYSQLSHILSSDQISHRSWMEITTVWSRTVTHTCWSDPGEPGSIPLESHWEEQGLRCLASAWSRFKGQ